MKLTTANTLTHHRHESLINNVIVEMTELKFTLSIETLKNFSDDLAQHMHAEETHIQPLLESSDNKLARQVEGDHKILLRTLNKCRKTLEQLEKTDVEKKRLLMVQNLDAFIRLRAVLEHHTIRETELVYEALDQQKHNLPENIVELLS